MRVVRIIASALGSFVWYVFVLTVACMFVFCQVKYINSR